MVNFCQKTHNFLDESEKFTGQNKKISELGKSKNC